MFDLKTEPFSLVLSGGGALGIAHLGVIHDLQNLAKSPDQIIGTSMGGIIGACLAIGMSESDIYSQIKAFSKVTNWVKFSFGGNAIIDTKKIEGIFDQLFADRRMSDTDIPLKLITTRLKDGQKKVFDSTDDILIKDGLLATMAIPGVFKEHEIDGDVYADGFLCENLGISEADCDNVLAVDVLGKHSFTDELPDNFFKTSNVLEMLEKSMRLIIYNQTQCHLNQFEKNIMLIEPSTHEFKTFQFHLSEDIRLKGLGLLKV